MKLKYFILTLFAAISFISAKALVVTIDIDDPDAVKLYVTLDQKPVPIVKGENKIEFVPYEDYCLKPVDGYKINGLVAYDADGKECLTHDWTYNVWNGEYTTAFIKQNDGYKYVFTTTKAE